MWVMSLEFNSTYISTIKHTPCLFTCFAPFSASSRYTPLLSSLPFECRFAQKLLSKYKINQLLLRLSVSNNTLTLF